MSRNLIVSIIGRPNVGKSSIFNTFIKQGKKALTHDRPGITRDRHYAIASIDEHNNIPMQEFILIDTGGFFPEGIDQKMAVEDHFFDKMTEHAKLAIEESDLVLLVVDVREGLTPYDQSIANEIRKSKKDFWILVNKVDNPEQNDLYDFYTLGVDSEFIFSVSAAHARGLRDFKEKLQTKLFELGKDKQSIFLQKGVTPREQVVSRVALIGSPNAGKSTLLNQLIGKNRALVSDIPGTTLDPIEGFFDIYFGEESHLLDNVEFTKDDKLLLKDYEFFSKNNENNEESFSIDEVFEQDLSQDEEQLETETEVFQAEEIDSEAELSDVEEKVAKGKEEGSFWRTIHLIDTAGIRKKSHVTEVVEEKSVFRSLRCITESDITILMVDITIGVSHHDRRLIDIALEKGKSIIVVLNKIDILKDELSIFKMQKEWISDIKAKHPWLEFCAIVPISAKYKKGLNALKKAITKTVLVRHIKVPTGILNKVANELIEKNPLNVKNSGGAVLKLKYVSQLKSNPPTFLFFTNKSRGISDNYLRYLKNALRNEFRLVNTPVHLIFRTSAELEKRASKYKALNNLDAAKQLEQAFDKE